MNGLRKAIDQAGGVTALAKKIGELPQTVSAWEKRAGGRVPAEHCPSIELETGVPCEELRPDVKWWVVRGRPDAANDAQMGGSRDC